MSWLVVRKVLPPMLVGEPPSYERLIAETPKNPAPTHWKIVLDDEPFGEAVNRQTLLEDDVTRYESRVLLRRLPLEKLPIAGLAESEAASIGLEMETTNSVEVDPLGRLISFEIAMRLGSIERAVVLLGTVDANELNLTVSAGQWSYENTSYISDETMIADSLSPQPLLPGLRIGQTWTIPVYNPLSPQSRAVEILVAKVERQEFLHWNGRGVSTLLVQYYRDAGAGLAADSLPRARAWVRGDGVVLQQEMDLFGSQLRFVRLPDEGDLAKLKPSE